MMLDDDKVTSLDNYQEEEILNMLSDDIILDNILNQIKNSTKKENILDTKSNLLEYFQNRYSFIMKKYAENEDVISKTNDIINDVLDEILNAINETFKFKITLSESLLIKDKFEFIESLYEFFILNLKDSLISLGYEYIIDNLKSLRSSLKIRNKKDLSYINIKKLIDNENTAVVFQTESILSNLGELDNETIIEMMTEYDPELVYNYNVRRLFLDNFCCDVCFDDEFFNHIKLLLNNAYVIQIEIQKKLIEKLK